ncbi:hypothetical protein DM860_011927 [Cuscuta australis]|uniref:Uncharacterized protein n=1 Tax=Cuscuta australis TaxID=267555 RepID=A0A328D9I8_9ASTE|nr:hypothetical protein DM860_011927 [Cuscuta australis]
MEKNQQKVSNPSAEKKTPSKYSNSNVRRSCRLQKLGSLVRSELAAEKIDLTAEETPQAQLIDSGYSEEQVGITPLVHEIDNGDDEKHDDEQVSMEEKIDFLYRTAKEPKKSKASKHPLPSGTTYEDLNYKSLYIDSHIKNEALAKENSKLAKELDYALGKIEAVRYYQILYCYNYEKMNGVIGKQKEMIVLTNLGKAGDSVINLSQLMAATPNSSLEMPGEKCGADNGGGGASKSKGTKCCKRKITS